MNQRSEMIGSCCRFPAYHVVLDSTRVVLRQRTGRPVKVDDVGVGEEVHARDSTREAHDRSVPDAEMGKRILWLHVFGSI